MLTLEGRLSQFEEQFRSAENGSPVVNGAIVTGAEFSSPSI